MIELINVGYSYEGPRGRSEALAQIHLKMSPNEKIVILGANGTGKTTLLKLINGLLFPTEGQITYRGTVLCPATLRRTAFGKQFRSEVALVFQNPDVMLFHPTVEDEIAFGPRQKGLSESEAREISQNWAEIFGLKEVLTKSPFELSGGQKKRVCFAAAMALEPQLLLLDEPLAHLDPRTTDWLMNFLTNLKISMITTNHNLSLANQLGERALVIGENHELVFDGQTSEFLSKLTPRESQGQSFWFY